MDQGISDPIAVLAAILVPILDTPPVRHATSTYRFRREYQMVPAALS